MKDKSKKSTYSTTFGVDPRNIRELKTMMKQMKYEATQEFERLAETISEWFTIEGLGSMRRLSLKSTLFGVDPKISVCLRIEA